MYFKCTIMYQITSNEKKNRSINKYNRRIKKQIVSKLTIKKYPTKPDKINRATNVDVKNF